MAQRGSVLMAGRASFLAQLSTLAAQAHRNIAGDAQDETLAIHYRPDVRDADALATAFQESRASDLRRRLTQRGPHRDDAEILISGRPARVFGSQGQQKSAALALKLAETELLRSRTGEYPVLMLDEVLAELDAQRARSLFAAVDEQVQVIVTTTSTERNLDVGGRPVALFRMAGGCLEPEE
jgi:DNA replication and repair protein RecF